jgi:hypothetical protein
MTSLLFHDFETRSLSDLTVTGTMKYALDASTRMLLWSWAVNDDPVKLWCPDLSAELVPEVWAYVSGRMAKWGTAPPELHALLAEPDTYAVAWNSGFDRACWQQVASVENGFPDIRIEQTLDAMAAAQASNLPGSLDFAGRALNLGTKTIGGKAIMKRFADAAQPLPGSPADIAALMERGLSRERAIAVAIEAWGLYLDYSVQDTELMRDVWKCTRPLDVEEWTSYWTSEKINDRGMLADLEVCRGAMAYREEEAAHVIEQIKTITNGQIAGPTFTAQINAWLFERLSDDLREFMIKERDAETGEAVRLTGAKDVMTRLLEEIELSDTPPADEVIDLIEVLQFGRASSAVKFEKIYNQAIVDDTPGQNREVGRLCGSYVFNGAGQTGRFCLAEGSMILVRNIVGIVEERMIEQVTEDDEVWDGDQWVTHEGVVFSGVKEVFEYDGVTATADHQVFVSDSEKIPLREAAERGSPIFKGTTACTQYTKSPRPPADATSE